jgi:putative DNA primase/helicase
MAGDTYNEAQAKPPRKRPRWAEDVFRTRANSEAPNTRRKANGADVVALSPSAPLDSARELARRRYSHQSGRMLHHQQAWFYEWMGTRYREVDREEIRAVVYQFLDGAKRLNDDEKLVPFNPTRNKVADVLDALAAATQLPGTVRAPAWLDTASRPDPMEILACSNGLLHLPSRNLLPHTTAFFGVNAVGYAYDPNAGPPQEWLKFLASIFPRDQQSIDTLQELFGLLLTPDTRHHKAFLFVGGRRSGKGTIARVLTALLGPENVAGPTLNSLAQNFGLASLIGKTLAIISDARLGGRTDVHVIAERILSITGEDRIDVDRKFKEPWTGQLPTRFVILSNELPRLSDASGALASRFIVLLFTQSFYGREDHGLIKRLLPELPAILLWALVGRDRLAQRGYFLQPKSAMQAVRELEDLASPIGAFLRDCCEVGRVHSVRPEALYERWTKWCDQQHRDHPGTVQTFGRDLRAALPGLIIVNPRDAAGKPVRYYQGLGLQGDAP